MTNQIIDHIYAKAGKSAFEIGQGLFADSRKVMVRNPLIKILSQAFKETL